SLFILTQPAPTASSTLSLHDALPISVAERLMMPVSSAGTDAAGESLESRTTLTPEAESAAVARAFVTETLLLWGAERVLESATLDRKSTRLNSSHLVISYAVFCLKKK